MLETAVWGGHTYYLLDEGTWTAKKTEANALGGHLASISSAEENQFLYDLWVSPTLGLGGRLNPAIEGVNEVARPERLAGLKLERAAHLPAVHQHSQRAGGIRQESAAGAEREFVNPAEGHPVSAILVRDDLFPLSLAALPAAILAFVTLTWRRVPYLLKRSALAAFDDNCFGIAKAAAYSALLSIFPVIGTVAAILVQTRAGVVMGPLERFLSEVLPPGTEEVVLEQFRVRGERPSQLLVIAGLLSLYAAAAVVKSLIEGFQAAYRVPRSRSFLRGNAVAMALVLLSAMPLIGASALIVFGSQVERQVMRWLHVDPRLTPFAWLWELVSRLARYAVAFATTTAVTGILYYFGPYRRQRWRNVWPGAVLATVLWMLATGGFAWYVKNLANYNVLYGSIGTSIALLVWMYLMAAIALLGCEFNAEYERLQKL